MPAQSYLRESVSLLHLCRDAITHGPVEQNRVARTSRWGSQARAFQTANAWDVIHDLEFRNLMRVGPTFSQKLKWGPPTPYPELLNLVSQFAFKFGREGAPAVVFRLRIRIVISHAERRS